MHPPLQVDPATGKPLYQPQTCRAPRFARNPEGERRAGCRATGPVVGETRRSHLPVWPLPSPGPPPSDSFLSCCVPLYLQPFTAFLRRVPLSILYTHRRPAHRRVPVQHSGGAGGEDERGAEQHGAARRRQRGLHLRQQALRGGRSGGAARWARLGWTSTCLHARVHACVGAAGPRAPRLPLSLLPNA